MVLLTHLGRFGYKIDCKREKLSVGYGYGCTANSGLKIDLDTSEMIPEELRERNRKYPMGFQVTLRPRPIERKRRDDRLKDSGVTSGIFRRRENKFYTTGELIQPSNGHTIKNEPAYSVVWTIPYVNGFDDYGRFFNFCAVVGESKVKIIELAIQSQSSMVKDTGENFDRDGEKYGAFSSVFDILLNIEHTFEGKRFTYRSLPHLIYPPFER